jgi:hypothetical protein
VAARLSPLREDSCEPIRTCAPTWRGSSCRRCFCSSSVFAYHLYYFEVPNQFVVPLPGRPLARALVFPTAVVPNVWGLRNVLHLAVGRRLRISLGVHGALLPLVLMPAGTLLVSAFDVFRIQWRFALPMVPIAMATYYLAWKYLVGFLNGEVGIE